MTRSLKNSDLIRVPEDFYTVYICGLWCHNVNSIMKDATSLTHAVLGAIVKRSGLFGSRVTLGLSVLWRKGDITTTFGDGDILQCVRSIGEGWIMGMGGRKGE